MKVLREDNENEYAKALHEVEDVMRKNEVSLSYIGGYYFIKIKDLECSMKAPEFPRTFEEDVLEVWK